MEIRDDDEGRNIRILKEDPQENAQRRSRRVPKPTAQYLALKGQSHSQTPNPCMTDYNFNEEKVIAMIKSQLDERMEAMKIH